MATSNSTVNAINTLMFNPGPAEYYTDAFRQVLEDHMAFLRTNQGTTIRNVTPQNVWENEQDLFGFLQSINLAPQFHWVVMRMNNMTSPTQFVKGVSQLLMPPINLLEQLRSAFLTSSVMGS